ncbi:MAG: phage terminase large subunit [Deltaproteobacteria bacterium]|nr:phage terminase large subunit [Deltaproteobacteria bacterium]
MTRIGAIFFVIICMTQWSSLDICGRIVDDPDEYKEWYHLRLPAFDGKKMLCPDILNKRRWNKLQRTMDKAVFLANYQQEQIDIKGRLYPNIKTYDELPRGEKGELLTEGIYAYFDIADEGSDYLAGAVYSVWQGFAYILDVLFSKENAEITEPQAAEMLNRNSVGLANFESNSGGRYYARNVERLLREAGNNSTGINTFFQSQNKVGRIRSKASEVQRLILMPKDWRNRWPEFFNHIYKFQSDVKKNEHDDGADLLTGIIERMVPSIGFLK